MQAKHLLLPLHFTHGILPDRYLICWLMLHCMYTHHLQEEYSAAHQCFVTENSLYVLCWRVYDREEGINELKDWLLTIKVVGTYIYTCSILLYTMP